VQVDERALGDVTILDVDGRMSIEGPDRLVCGTVRRLLPLGRKQFLLNLARVPYIDSTGLAEILEAYATTKRQGGGFKLEHLSPHVRELLRITALLTVFEVFDSEADALASFGSATR
jgi:anti-sigma B factor antagonist